MEFHEYGRADAPAVLVMHGMMQHWRSMHALLSSLADQYRLIFAAMDGFYEGSSDFTTFADQARQIEEYVQANCGGHGTFPTHRRRRTAITTAIDNVFVKGFEILGVQTADDALELSDHRLLVCRLGFGGAETFKKFPLPKKQK